MRDTDQAFCLPVPEKAQRAHNFVLFLHQSAPSAEKQFVWSMPETVTDGTKLGVDSTETYVDVTRAELNIRLKAHGRQVIVPDKHEFASAIPQSHRKGEVGYHVKAHIGSKEGVLSPPLHQHSPLTQVLTPGFLFFLPTGILWAFRKPLSYYPFERISSISYTSVLTRTFNLVISHLPPDPAEGEAASEVEFAIIDQADFAGIDAYIKKHGLNDASLAVERMAKRYGVNAPNKGPGV